MSKLRTSSFWFAIACTAVACTTDSDSDTTNGGTTSVDPGTTTLIGASSSGTSESSGSDSSTTAVVGSSSSSTSGASSSSTGFPPQDGPPVCQNDCELPSDCCAPDDPGCPSVVYPGNFGCVEGVCVPPACESDEECENAFPGTTCHRAFGNPQCVRLCDEDPTICDETQTACSGMTDAGLAYCRETCNEGGTLQCFTTTCDEASGLCLCEPGQCPTGAICAPLN